MASALAGHSPRGLACRLDDAEAEADVALIGRLLDTEYGLEATAGQGTLTVAAPSERTAASLASWSVAKAVDTGITGVTVGDRRWTRSRDSSAWSWQPTDTPAPANQVVLHLT